MFICYSTRCFNLPIVAVIQYAWPDRRVFPHGITCHDGRVEVLLSRDVWSILMVLSWFMITYHIDGRSRTSNCVCGSELSNSRFFTPRVILYKDKALQAEVTFVGENGRDYYETCKFDSHLKYVNYSSIDQCLLYVHNLHIWQEISHGNASRTHLCFSLYRILPCYCQHQTTVSYFTSQNEVINIWEWVDDRNCC